MDYAKFMKSSSITRPMCIDIHYEIRDLLTEIMDSGVREYMYFGMNVEKMSNMTKALKLLCKDVKIDYDIESMEYKINMENCDISNVFIMHQMYDVNEHW